MGQRRDIMDHKIDKRRPKLGRNNLPKRSQYGPKVDQKGTRPKVDKKGTIYGLTTIDQKLTKMIRS